MRDDWPPLNAAICCLASALFWAWAASFFLFSSALVAVGALLSLALMAPPLHRGKASRAGCVRSHSRQGAEPPPTLCTWFVGWRRCTRQWVEHLHPPPPLSNSFQPNGQKSFSLSPRKVEPGRCRLPPQGLAAEDHRSGLCAGFSTPLPHPRQNPHDNAVTAISFLRCTGAFPPARGRGAQAGLWRSSEGSGTLTWPSPSWREGLASLGRPFLCVPGALKPERVAILLDPAKPGVVRTTVVAAVQIESFFWTIFHLWIP